MVKIKRYVKYLVFVAPIMFLLPGCEKQQGPFYSDLQIITDFKAYPNHDTCSWNNFKIIPRFNGTIVFESGISYNGYIYIPNQYFVKEISIYTMNDYNNKFKANDDVSKIFDIYNHDLLADYFIETVENFRHKPISNIIFKINEPPGIDGQQRFIIKVNNGAGEILRDTTEIVYLLKD
ncbi:MAG: hypothetical protein ACP5DZ_10570 [Bacteroidales bacterium]